MAMEVGKGNGKGKMALVVILFMKIMEIRTKWRRKVIELPEEENWRKKEENEENIGLNDKKASED